jgi:hypothetical protein
MIASIMRFSAKVVVVGFLLIFCGSMADGYDHWGRSGGRSYYGTRNSNFYYGPYWGSQRNCYTYYYYYLPTPEATSYSYHTAFYYPKTVGSIRGNYYYYKNQRTGRYWGRCAPGSDNYELLPEASQKANLAMINEKDFQPQGKMTPVPDMNPPAPIIPPPQPTVPPAE